MRSANAGPIQANKRDGRHHRQLEPDVVEEKPWLKRQHDGNSKEHNVTHGRLTAEFFGGEAAQVRP